MDHASDAFFLQGDDAIILNVNRRACESLGYTRDELVGKTPLNFDPDLTVTMLDEFLRRLRGGETLAFESRHRRKDGGVFPVEVKCQAFWEGGQCFTVALARDVTERKQAEEALRCIAQLPDENPYPVMRIDRAGAVLYANRSSAALGGQWQCVAGHPASDPLARLVRETLDSGQPNQMDLESGGRVFSFLFAPVAGSGYVNIYGRDITDRKRAEDALRESEERFRGTFENAAVGIIHNDSAGRFLRVNERYCAIVGHPREELLQKAFHEITHPDDLPNNVALYMAMMRGESPGYTLEKRYLRKDGSPIWVELFSSLQRDAAGRPAYAIGVVQDISERKRLEEELGKVHARLELALRGSNITILELNMPDGVLETGRWEVVVFANQARGYDRSEWATDFATVMARVHPEDREQVQRHARPLGQPSQRVQGRMSDPEQGWLVRLDSRTRHCRARRRGQSDSLDGRRHRCRRP